MVFSTYVWEWLLDNDPVSIMSLKGQKDLTASFLYATKKAIFLGMLLLVIITFLFAVFVYDMTSFFIVRFYACSSESVGNLTN